MTLLKEHPGLIVSHLIFTNHCCNILYIPTESYLICNIIFKDVIYITDIPQMKKVLL